MSEEIVITGLNQFYGKKQVLKDVNLNIGTGMFGLLGRNGAGKTTLMKVLATLLPVSHGEVTVCGIPISMEAHIRRITGYLPQEFSFYANMTVYETMDYLGVLSGLGKAERQEKIHALLARVNLLTKKRVKVKALSGGMKRRLGIAQAILHDPKVLIVDEPTAGLDAEERVRFRNLESALQSLIREYSANRYVTYPIGFYKEVTLSEKKQAKMLEIIREITGLDELSTEQPKLSISEDLSHERFKELMKQADKLLGGGSMYSESYLKYIARVPTSYEEALQAYNDIIYKDRLSGAYARLFCDYLGIVLTILPVFLAVTRALRDKRAGINQVIYSKRASSASIILSRYLSIVLLIMLPVFIIAGYLSARCLYYGANEGINVDAFAFFKYCLFWLLPAVMISSSVGIFLTELTQTAIAIVVMGIWWFISLFMGVADLGGGYGWNLIPRHNTIGNYQVFIDNLKLLVLNRLCYSLLAILLAAAAVLVYDLKRRGKLAIYGKKASIIKGKP